LTTRCAYTSDCEEIHVRHRTFPSEGAPPALVGEAKCLHRVFFIPNIYREVSLISWGRAAFGGSPNRASNRQPTGGLLSVSVLGGV
jgi:hypothetical protein